MLGKGHLHGSDGGWTRPDQIPGTGAVSPLSRSVDWLLCLASQFLRPPPQICLRVIHRLTGR